MHKFFVSNENIIDGLVTIVDEDVKHIYKVLRLNPGDKICINNCSGQEYLAEIIEINKKEVKAQILENMDTDNESPINVTIYQGLPKAAKMDLIVQKNTELGVKEITPVMTERVVVKGELKEYKKVDRWNRIALEACKQSKRSYIPKINNPLGFNNMLEELCKFQLVVVPYENKEGYGIKKLVEDIKNLPVKDVAIIIGPEGGFEEREISKLEEIGAHIVTLGPRILRTETAGFTCLSLIMYELGDLGGNM
ncbi:16S rRNA (uracil(1498)-N(3))-methyltransferase [Haloimpatiens lingqiaonensis]|uniref:16S rRNA (uracil(1498)-N(3))-methyltransferase n=1 Tax=Haloimpatiens lingqiaonensis TaxID=1380675 RepID=UPI0010FDA6D6|nr:16S rRNA (uracil(1498)-N(3))-methyltransferase [Haloimpatiens lingqiaonensis]